MDATYMNYMIQNTDKNLTYLKFSIIYRMNAKNDAIKRKRKTLEGMDLPMM